MSPAVLKLAPTPLSPERQALADAIAEAAPKRAAADEARAKAEAARGSLTSALSAVPAAERAAEDAKAHIIDNPHAPRSDLRAKRQAVADAVDDLAIAREVSSRADAAEVEADRSARYAAEKVETAASAVLVAVYTPIIEAAEHAARDAAALAFAAHWIGQHGTSFDGERKRLTDRATVLNPHFAFGMDGNAADVARQAAVAPWAIARAALMSDPSTPLPEIGR